MISMDCYLWFHHCYNHYLWSPSRLFLDVFCPAVCLLFSSVSKVGDLQFYINPILFQAPNQDPSQAPSQEPSQAPNQDPSFNATPEILQEQKLGDPSDKVMTGDYPSSLTMGYKIHMFNVRHHSTFFFLWDILNNIAPIVLELKHCVGKNRKFVFLLMQGKKRKIFIGEKKRQDTS